MVQPGDTLGVNVLNYDLIDDSQQRLKGLDSGNVVVDSGGSISLPFVGTLKVAGHTPHQINLIIEHRLSDCVIDPAVILRLVDQNQVIFLTGAITGTLTFLRVLTLSTNPSTDVFSLLNFTTIPGTIGMHVAEARRLVAKSFRTR